MRQFAEIARDGKEVQRDEFVFKSVSKDTGEYSD